jgi:hypothetical protein
VSVAPPLSRAVPRRRASGLGGGAEFWNIFDFGKAQSRGGLGFGWWGKRIYTLGRLTQGGLGEWFGLHPGWAQSKGRMVQNDT